MKPHEITDSAMWQKANRFDHSGHIFKDYIIHVSMDIDVQISKRFAQPTDLTDFCGEFSVTVPREFFLQACKSYLGGNYKSGDQIEYKDGWKSHRDVFIGFSGITFYRRDLHTQLQHSPFMINIPLESFEAMADWYMNGDLKTEEKAA